MIFNKSVLKQVGFSIMSTLCVTLAFVLSVGLVSSEKPVVNCPAPRSPPHGQSFLYQDGQVVKYVCEPGFEIRGRPTARCVDGAWEEPTPMCMPMGETDDLDDLLLSPEESPDLMAQPQRPLFNWGGDDDIDDDDIDDGNSTSTDDDDDTPLGDQARVTRVVYPNRVLLRNAMLRRAALRSRVIELEEADKKNKEAGGRSVLLQGPPPSVLYLRRSGKSSDGPAGQQVRTAAVEQEGEGTEQPQGDKGGDAQRQYYWWAAQHYYQHPQSAALVDYTSVHPYGLTESQMAWINSLHPETRDQYLRDIYGVRTDHIVEAQRAQAFLSRYGDAYNYYHHPYYYYREPLALLTQQDIVSKYDYSCNQAGSPFVRAPKLRNAHIAKYDRRQNPNSPKNHYLAVVYRCNPGYVMYDTRHTDLFCSKRSWIGTDPVCVRARV